jgi:hypothetical protein
MIVVDTRFGSVVVVEKRFLPPPRILDKIFDHVLCRALVSRRTRCIQEQLTRVSIRYAVIL